MQYRCLCLIYTYKCTAKCDICCFSCSEERNEKMSIDFAIKLIEQAKENGINIVGITGGEPFIYIDEIFQVLDLSTKLGLFTTITTNAFWGENKEYAKKILEKLSQYSLRSIKISIDEFHKEFIPIKSVENIISLSKKYGIRVVVGCTSTKTSRMKDSIIGFNDSIIDIGFFEHKCYPLGRAKEKINPEDFFKYNITKGVCQEGEILTVDYNGNTYPCGNTCGLDIKRKLGNAKEQTLRELITSAENNVINKIIKEHGFEKIYKLLIENIECNIEDKHVDICHLCYDIHKKVRVEDLEKLMEVNKC